MVLFDPRRVLLGVCLLASALAARSPADDRPPAHPALTAADTAGDFLVYVYLDPAAAGSGLTPDGLQPVASVFGLLPQLAEHVAREADPERLAALGLASKAAAAGRPVAVWLLPLPGDDRVASSRGRDWLIAIEGLSAASGLAKAGLPGLMEDVPKGSLRADRRSAQDLLLIGTPTTLSLWPAEGGAASAAASVAAREWPSHRTKAAQDRPVAPAICELAINLNSVRHADSAAFAAERAADAVGLGTDVLAALRWSNARTVGLHIHAVKPEQVLTRDPELPRAAGLVDAPYHGPPLLIVDVTWSARSEPPGTVRKLALSAGHWPSAQLGDPPEAAAVACIRPALKGLIFRVIDLATAVSAEDEHAAVVSARQRWALECAGTSGPLDRTCNGLGPWTAVLLLHPPQSPAAAATLRLRTRPRSGASAETITKSIGQLLASQPALCEKQGPDSTPTWAARPAARWCISGIRFGFVPDQTAFEAEFDLGSR